MSDSSSDEEDVGNGNPLQRFGNPLKEIEAQEPLKKPVAVHEQIVTDEQGRRRFHGAFTGGFSAGYYNTVGTKEGWTPSTFRSSRKDKENDKKTTQPEDYMDEEDLNEYGIAPTQIVTKTDFTQNHRKEEYAIKSLFPANETTALGMDMLTTLITPAKTNIGIRLLQKMGWREGQGVGPRVKTRKRKHFTEDDVSGIPFPDQVTFAPHDVAPIDFTPKGNVYGLGYTRLDPTLALHNKIESSTGVSMTMKSGKKLSIKGKAFGVGAFEEEDDDIYSRDSLANYDIAMTKELERDKSYGWSKPTLAIEDKKKRENMFKLEDLLRGFKLSTQTKSCLRKIYQPPIIPKHFVANRRKRVGAIKALKSSSSVSESTIGVHLNAIDRQNLLGEEKIFKPTDSIFELLKPKDRERLKNAKNIKKEPKKERTPSPEPPPPEKHALVKNHEVLRKEGKALFQPFASRPDKQKRYENFLENRKNSAPDPYFGIDKQGALTEWQRSEERQEFFASASVFQPLLSGSNSRFTTQTQILEAPKKGGLHFAKDVDSGGDAAKMQMFGFMTREVFEWHPDSIICKRFNVPDPYPDSDFVGIPTDELPGQRGVFDPFSSMNITDARKSDKVSKPKKSAILVNSLNPTSRPDSEKTVSRWDKKPTLQGPKSLSGKDVAAVGAPTSSVLDDVPEDQPADKADDKPSEEEEMEVETMETKPKKPPIDFFKSIFASSEEESSSSENESDDENGDESNAGAKENVGQNNEPEVLPVGKSANPRIKFVSKAERAKNKLNSNVSSSRKEEEKSNIPVEEANTTVTESSVKTANNDTNAADDDDTNDKEKLDAFKSKSKMSSNGMISKDQQTSPNEVISSSNGSTTLNIPSVDEEDYFGPALPPPGSISNQISEIFTKVHSTRGQSSSDESIENQKKKKKHKQQKVKKKKKKSKKNKK